MTFKTTDPADVAEIIKQLAGSIDPSEPNRLKTMMRLQRLKMRVEQLVDILAREAVEEEG